MERSDYLVLVNKDNKIPNNWEEKVKLIELKNVFNRTIKVEEETLEKYNELRDNLLKE
jgi:transcription antitermination factor NusG